MPQLGETVTEGTITRWLKQVGEPVARDEPLFEVSTDKVDSEVPSPAGGVVSEIRVPEGETVDVGTVLAVVSDGAGATGSDGAAATGSDGAAATGSGSAVATGGPVPSTAPPAQPETPVQESAPAEPAPSAAALPVEAAPPASAPPAPQGPPPTARPAQAPPPSAPVPQAPAPVAAQASVPEQASVPSGNGWDRVLSPVVRRLINEHQMDPGTLAGSGPGGRITRADVLNVIDAQASAPSPTAAQAPQVVAGRAVAPVPTPPVSRALAGTDEVIPFTNIRRRTAEHMVRSKATSPHTLVVLEADYENVERTRRSEGNTFKTEEGFSLTYLPFVARATVEALHEWPNLNSSVGDDSLIVHHSINLGIAVDLDHQGLIVPVVHGAEELTLRGMARRIRDISTRARSKQLNMDDISGGTFSLTNAGPFGTFLTAPIINQPQVAILSTDGVKRRPVVVNQQDGTEAIAIHSIGLLCLSWDHRAVDGAYAAAFLARIVDILGTRDWSAEL